MYAIEASSMAEQAKSIVKANRMEDRIEIIQSKVEDVDLDVEVDVIVSEWMVWFSSMFAMSALLISVFGYQI